VTIQFCNPSTIPQSLTAAITATLHHSLLKSMTTTFPIPVSTQQMVLVLLCSRQAQTVDRVRSPFPFYLRAPVPSDVLTNTRLRLPSVRVPPRPCPLGTMPRSLTPFPSPPTSRKLGTSEDQTQLLTRSCCHSRPLTSLQDYRPTPFSFWTDDADARGGVRRAIVCCGLNRSNSR
jgi:hypothetical protein